MKHNIYILLHACSATVRFLHSWADLSTCFSKSGLSCFSFSGFWRNQPSLPWHTLAGLEAGINFFSFLYFFYSRAFLTSSRFLFASHSEKLAISIRAPFFVHSVVLLASHSEKLAISLLFASHSKKLAISIRAPFFERSVFFYLRAILKSSQSLFARHSRKRCVLFFLGLPNGTYQL